MKFKTYIFIFSFSLCVAFEALAKEPIQNRMTWYNKSLSSPDGGQWHLHISDLPENSGCNFGVRKFDPSIAISKAMKWARSNAFNYETLLVKEVVIHKMGKGWEDCVYIVEIFNEKPWVQIEIGVSLDGTKLYVPEKN